MSGTRQAHPRLSVLTEPTPFFNPRGFTGNLNRALPLRLRTWIRRAGARSIGGHAAVTRSLLQGLETLGYPHNYNPLMQRCIAEHCLVLSNEEALRQAILLKRAGKIKRLVAGPNVFVLPSDMDALIASPEVDLCLVPSEWVKQVYLTETPTLAGRIAIWAAGVDIAAWTAPAPRAPAAGPVILLYVKSGMSEDELVRLHDLLASHGASVIRLDYGQYNAGQFRQSLAQADLCIFVSASESQGIALQEAWSCDRPTWVFDPGFWTAPDARRYPASSAPYLSAACGHAFSELGALAILLKRWENGELHYAPRHWVCRHMTDQASAERLTSLLFD
ncbi:hypothetical protein [Herbaspirillum aquaticum]|jgi:hypothetical protein|uniref:hypothetical protein n=1 Tax=Herbaspirillum aquaticum TaxID=568783 RepID=UPI0024DED948|nr:hypothetical protein [Herbaspirillum aquaticum]